VKTTLLFLLLTTVVSCTASTVGKLNLESEKEYVQFTYNNDISFGFSIPSDGINITPNHLEQNSTTHFSTVDIEKRKSKRLWILKTTYHPIQGLTYSGKYSVGLVVSSVGTEKDIHLQDIEDIEVLRKKYYKEEFNRNKLFEHRKYESQRWLWNESRNEIQSIISASLVLDEKVYLTIVFEYLGNDIEELLLMQKIADDTLRSFRFLRGKDSTIISQ
jgi:hypothetical protein